MVRLKDLQGIETNLSSLCATPIPAMAAGPKPPIYRHTKRFEKEISALCRPEGIPMPVTSAMMPRQRAKLPEVKAEAPVVPENAEADEQDRDALGNDSGDSHPGYSEREADDKQKIEDDVDAAGYQKNQERMAGIPDRRRMPAPML